MGRLNVGNGPVGLDTSIFIHYIEAHRKYLPLVEPIFQAADAGGVTIVTSAVTLLELLVMPYRNDDAPLATKYEQLLTRSRGVRLVALDHSQLRAAAYLRASHGLRTMDAIQLAAALASGCSTFVTNDLKLPKIPGLKVVQLKDLI